MWLHVHLRKKKTVPGTTTEDFGDVTTPADTTLPQTSQIFPPAIDGEAYYVDSVNGNDSNDGKTLETAFRTLSRVNKITLKNGGSLLFRAGCEFKGSLKPKRERDGTTVYIGSWGEGDDPIIIAPRGNALILNDFDHVEVSNLTLTNPNGICGIYVSNESGGAVKGVHI